MVRFNHRPTKPLPICRLLLDIGTGGAWGNLFILLPRWLAVLICRPKRGTGSVGTIPVSGPRSSCGRVTPCLGGNEGGKFLFTFPCRNFSGSSGTMSIFGEALSL